MNEFAGNEARDHLPFAKHHAFIIGIDAYEKVSTLQTAVADAQRLAEVLSEQQHFAVYPPLLDAKGSDIRRLFQTMSEQVGKDDRVFFYFAGHGIAADGDDGPAGHIVPADAEPTDVKTFIPMADLQMALDGLPCRHLLVVLDCCFSGAFKWSSRSRDIGTLIPRRIYKERFDRFIADPAWQVITSAAYDQRALDVLEGKATGDRGRTNSADDTPHSPFARALFEALAGSADVKGAREGDGVITATELYAFIRDQVEPETTEADQQKRQTPRFFPLRKHDKGEFIFLHPRHRLNLPPIPKRSPYKGLESFDEDDQLLFYGRDDAIKELRTRAKHNRLVVVSGASGTGKSSVIKAGLLPVLRSEGFRILPVMRPGSHPVAELDRVLEEASTTPADGADEPAGGRESVLVIDQFEEVITRCTDLQERDQFNARLRELLDDGRIHRLILTVRADFEPQLDSGPLHGDWLKGRYTVPPFSLEELKEVIVLPTLQEVLMFDPPELVDEIVAEVVQSPGALPLLSYTLSELYEAYRASGREDRALKQDDYDKLGGVMGALRTKAESLYASLQPAQRATMRKIVLRMVSLEGDLASRRVPMADLEYSADEDPRVEEVVERLVGARLVVKGRDYIEPAHDALVRAWKTLHDWIHAAGRDKLLLSERLGPEADEFARTGNRALLWYNKPHLAVAAVELHNPEHGFNAKEVAFIRKSVARNKRNTGIIRAITVATLVAMLALSIWALDERATATANARDAVTEKERAETEKERALQGMFSALRLNMNYGQPGSVCVSGLCAEAPPGDGDDAPWLSIGDLSPTAASFVGTATSRVFAAVRQYGQGHVLVYAHDGLLLDRELTPGSDNLQFAENALRWLTPPQQSCPGGITILLWQGTYARVDSLEQVNSFIKRRGWTLHVTSDETLEDDLRCAQVLWYLSDWDPPQNFASQQVPLIKGFVQGGGGLLVGGLGWSYAQQGGPQGTAALDPYAANELGAPFGFAFTTDAFQFDRNEPIELLSGQ
jgi:hypothetical protein